MKLEHDYVPRILEILEVWAAEPTGPVLPKPASTQTLSIARFSAGARQLITSAQALADERHHRHLTVVHVLVRLLALPAVQNLLLEAGADPSAAMAAAESVLAKVETSREASYLNDDTLALLKRLEASAGKEQVSLTALLAACVSLPSRKTLEEIDAAGMESPEEAARRTIIEAGKLDRFPRS